jgi:hypothetical protein
MKSLLVGLVVGMLLSPSSPQAADVERVQRACANLRRQYGTTFTDGLGTLKALGYLEKHHPSASGLPAVIDARVFDLFCE